MKYFAYGANMAEEEMKRHCINARFVSRARLPDNAFVYDNFSEEGAEGWGNIVSSPGKEVWGVLYEVSAEDFKSLEKKEGCPVYYQVRGARVVDDAGEIHKVSLFSREGKCKGKPSERYHSLVLKGAHNRSLPADYIRQFLE